jgi:hypothetical protein
MANSAYAVIVAATDYRAAISAARIATAPAIAEREAVGGEMLPAGKGEMIEEVGEVAEAAAPVIPVTLTLTKDGKPVESVTVDQCWQLTGAYGDTRRLVDLDDEALASVLSAWAGNVRASIAAQMADPAVAAEVAKVESLRERVARIEVA